MNLSPKAIAVFLMFLLIAGCGMSQEEARQKLADLNVEYEEDTFVDRASEGDATVVDLFLKSGMNPASEALLAAVEGEHTEVAQKLMEEGAKLKPDSDQTKLALLNNTKNGNIEIARLLVEAGVDPSFRFKGTTPLFVAAKYGHPEIVRSLLEAGVDPNIQASNGFTALIIASDDASEMSKEDRHAIVRSLLEAGADPNLEGPQDAGHTVTALLLANDSGYEEVAQMLREAGAE